MTTLEYWMMFLLGCFFHLLMQMQRSVNSVANGLRGWPGAAKWFEIQLIPILIRMFFSVIAFGLWRESPGSFGALGNVMPGDSWQMCGVFGFAVDEFLDKLTSMIPGLQIDIPRLVPPPDMASTITTTTTSKSISTDIKGEK